MVISFAKGTKSFCWLSSRRPSDLIWIWVHNEKAFLGLLLAQAASLPNNRGKSCLFGDVTAWRLPAQQLSSLYQLQIPRLRDQLTTSETAMSSSSIALRRSQTRAFGSCHDSVHSRFTSVAKASFDTPHDNYQRDDRNATCSARHQVSAPAISYQEDSVHPKLASIRSDGGVRRCSPYQRDPFTKLVVTFF